MHLHNSFLFYYLCFVNEFIHQMKKNLKNIMVGIWVQVPRLHRMMFVDGDLPFFYHKNVNDYVKNKQQYIRCTSTKNQ